MILFKKILKWTGKIALGILGVVGIFFIIVIIIRAFHFYNLDKTNVEVAKIHATKLTLDDVMGKNLPPDPGINADKTIAGIDANNNGIRDDVELAMFKEYPNSAKTRAVLLQYALALQMEFTQSIVNKDTVTEIVTEMGRAHSCVADTLVPRKSPESSRSTIEVDKIYTYTDFVENKQINTDGRKKVEKDFLKYLGSYGDSTNKECDLDLSTLLN